MLSAKVSIIVPVYNVEDYIARCLESLINQTYTCTEIILINDGSTDASPMICESYAENEKRIKIIHRENGGVSKARNEGLNSITGKWVLFVDADDILPRCAVDLLVNAAIDNNSGCVLGQIEQFAENEPTRAGDDPVDVKTETIDGPLAVELMLYQKKVINGPVAKLYSSKVVKAVRFSENLSYAEDLHFNYFALKDLDKVTLLNQAVYWYRYRPDSAINSRFTTTRMSGLGAIGSIINDTTVGNRYIHSSAVDRYFMEAVFILLKIENNSKFKVQQLECFRIIRSYRLNVLLNRGSPIEHRALALVSFIHPMLSIVPILAKYHIKTLGGSNL